jgi:ABC-type transporter Mla MlaB component/ABC-type uncharacterized transport system auxiliary subunit
MEHPVVEAVQSPEGDTVFIFRKPLDSEHAGDVWEAALHLTNKHHPRNLILDFSDIEIIDGAGIAFLRLLWRHCQKDYIHLEFRSAPESAEYSKKGFADLSHCLEATRQATEALACCSQSADEGVKIWPLTASSPYDRENMIVLDPSRLVQFSPQFRWVALPGGMITDMLLRDFTRGALFTTAVPVGNPFDVSLELGGHVFEFAWEQDGALGRAVLDVEISLWREAPKRRVLFRQHYHFESNPGTTNDSQAFAREMSELVGRLSAQLSRDLFATIQKGSLSPDAG